MKKLLLGKQQLLKW